MIRRISLGHIGIIEYGPSSHFIHTLTDGALKNVVEVGTVFVLPEYRGRRPYDLVDKDK